MRRLWSFVKGVGLGAGYMYYFDSVSGNRRRALLRDQLVHLTTKAGDAVDVGLRDAENRIYGTVAELFGRVAGRDMSDEAVVRRVRSRMGRWVTHPSAIDVSARNGVVTLSGAILADEVDDLLAAAKSVPGVDEIEDGLDVHATAENVPSLQGGRQRSVRPSKLLPTNWSPATRLTAATIGGTLAARYLARRASAPLMLSSAAIGLAMRALSDCETNCNVHDTDQPEGSTKKEQHGMPMQHEANTE